RGRVRTEVAIAALVRELACQDVRPFLQLLLYVAGTNFARADLHQVEEPVHVWLVLEALEEAAAEEQRGVVKLRGRYTVIQRVGAGIAEDPEPVGEAGRLSGEGGIRGGGGDELRGQLRRRAILHGAGAGPG